MPFLDRLKQHSLFGLAAAIAVGYVVAHIAIKILDVLYQTYFEESFLNAPGTWLSLAWVAVIVAWLLYRLRRNHPVAIQNGRRKLFGAAAVMVGIAALVYVVAALVDRNKTQPVSFDMKTARPIYLNNDGNPISPPPTQTK